MRNNRMPGDWLFKTVPWFIGAVFVLVIAGWIAFSVGIFQGLKALENCTLAVITETKDGQTSTSIGCKK